MATDFIITSENNPNLFADTLLKGEAVTYSFDFSPWAEDNSTITTATWTVETGQAAITSKTLSSNVITSLITVAESGGSLVKLIADTGTEIKVIFLDILAKDFQAITTRDYGLREC